MYLYFKMAPYMNQIVDFFGTSQMFYAVNPKSVSLEYKQINTRITV